MKGLIALDIDGTTAIPGKPISLEVIHYLKGLAQENWAIVFITGRTLRASEKILNVLPFNYFLAVQNGAILLEMPSKKIVNKKYLDKNVISVMQSICEGNPSDFVIYSGCEFDDVCYYRSRGWEIDLLDYIKVRSKMMNEAWSEVHSFDDLEIAEFASVKCFGTLESAKLLTAQIENQLGLHVPLISDPYNANYFVAQATHPDVTKGAVLKDLARIIEYTGPIIAAGDDYNDESMLSAAHIKIVMASAPKDMQAKATIIAPPITEHGIIVGITEAIKTIEMQRYNS